MFSSRLPARLAPNPLSVAVAARRAAGPGLLDLTVTNPTSVGIPYPDSLMHALSDPRAVQYAPDPAGLLDARDAVAADYARRGHHVEAAQVVLTSSTSEAYGWLFKLLCDPGDEVLVPQPSYPLFDLLTSLDGVVARPYRLDDHGVWSIDRLSLEHAISASTRAVLIVNPNNPTGSMLRRSDRDWLDALAASRGLVVIADEVFGDFPILPREDAVSWLGATAALSFTLGGLSKTAGLPQMKLGWIVPGGPHALVRDARARLEIIADTYLSVSTPVQWAAARLLDDGAGVRAAIQARIAENFACLRRVLPAFPAVSLREPEGGWTAVVQVPAVMPEETLVLRLLKDADVLVHPGYFFDFPSEAFLVVSLLPEPGIFAQGLDRLLPLAAGAPA